MGVFRLIGIRPADWTSKGKSSLLKPLPAGRRKKVLQRDHSANICVKNTGQPALQSSRHGALAPYHPPYASQTTHKST